MFIKLNKIDLATNKTRTLFINLEAVSTVEVGGIYANIKQQQIEFGAKVNFIGAPSDYIFVVEKAEDILGLDKPITSLKRPEQLSF